jgi:hypothetical protein
MMARNGFAEARQAWLDELDFFMNDLREHTKPRIRAAARLAT